MAVYTKVSENEVCDFLSSYALGTLTKLVGIKAGVSNSNYALETTEGRFILTLYESRTREEDLPFFLGLMEHLAKKGIPCPKPVRSRDQEVFRLLNGHTAAIVSFLSGKALTYITPQECKMVGEALALMHESGDDFPLRRTNTLSVSGWRELFSASKARAEEVQIGLTTFLEDELNTLQMKWPRDLPRGLIHADLFADNVFFFDNELVGIIDFYFACHDFKAYDLAICLNAWCFEGNNMSLNITKSRALLEGYEKKRPLTQHEKLSLPLLARGAAMRFIVTRLYDWLHPTAGAYVKSKDPLEYVARLKFHQKVTSSSTYGLEL